MKISKLANYLEDLEETSSRLKITEILADLLKNADEDEIDMIVYLILGRLAPNYKDIVFNLAERLMVETIAKAYEKDKEKVQSLYKEKGDLGIVAQKLAGRADSKLSVNDVYGKLRIVAKEEGEGSVERKVNEMADLLKDLDGLSARYVARIPVGKLRLGFSDKTVIDALSWMITGDKSLSKKIKKKYEVLPDVGQLAKDIKSKGVQKATRDSKPQIGIPVSPMLPQRIKSPKEMIEKMGEVAIEPKLDGLRIQIHYDSGRSDESRPVTAGNNDDFVAAFTRNMNEVTWMFPELQETGDYLEADRVILDVEAIGLDPEREKLANFQTTMTRRRKHEIGETAKQVPIKFYVFDVLLKDDRNLMREEYLERRKTLEEAVKDGKLFEVVDYVVTDDPDKIKDENETRRAEGLEGIIVKRVDAKYIPGRTGHRWVKMKEAEHSPGKLSDTVDCVVMGYFSGRGKRTQFGIGGFLAGVMDNDKFLTLTKVGTGLTDEQFKELHKRLKDLEVKDKPKQYDVHEDLYPDNWVTPDQVVELAADDITKSPKHTAGYALRFPRLVKFRDDKDADQATTLKEVRKFYKLQ